MPPIPRQPALQRRPRLLRGARLMPAPQVRDAVHVHIDADALVAAPRRAHAQIRHLGPDAGEGHQPGDGVGDVGGELVAQDQRGRLDVFGFEVVEADFVDVGVQRRGVDGEDGFEAEALLCTVRCVLRDGRFRRM